MFGIACLFSGGGEVNGVRGSRLTEFAGKLSLACAPLAAPATLGWSLGVFLIIDGKRLLRDRSDVVPLFMMNTCVLVVAILILSVSINFNFSEFIHQFSVVASLVSSGLATGSVKFEHVLKGVVFLAIAYGFRHKKPAAVQLIAALGAGQLFAAFMHDKGLIRNLATFIVVLLTLDIILNERYKVATWAAAALAISLFSTNLIAFRVFSKVADFSPDSVVADYRSDLGAKKTVLIDETMAMHYLDQRNEGAIAWIWSKRMPKNIPDSLNDLKAGEVWYVSKFTLFATLKGKHPISREVATKISYETTPQIKCFFGSISCNLPAKSWGVMRFERNGNEVLLKDYEEDKIFRFPS